MVYTVELYREQKIKGKKKKEKKAEGKKEPNGGGGRDIVDRNCQHIEFRTFIRLITHI